MNFRGVASLATLLLLTACGGSSESAEDDGDNSGGAYEDTSALISDVEDAGFTCWKWYVNDDDVFPQLLGTAASVSCYQSREDMESYIDEGLIALFNSTKSRDATIDMVMDGGANSLVVGPNYFVSADDPEMLERVAEALDGAELRGNEFDVN